MSNARGKAFSYEAYFKAYVEAGKTLAECKRVIQASVKTKKKSRKG